eukprot:scaffold224512_cov35-Tisochrysis_lutea.AAC.1
MAMAMVRWSMVDGARCQCQGDEYMASLAIYTGRAMHQHQPRTPAHPHTPIAAWGRRCSVTDEVYGPAALQ